MRWRSAFSLWFRNLAFLGCVHREERFRPDSEEKEPKDFFLWTGSVCPSGRATSRGTGCIFITRPPARYRKKRNQKTFPVDRERLPIWQGDQPGDGVYLYHAASGQVSEEKEPKDFSCGPGAFAPLAGQPAGGRGASLPRGLRPGRKRNQQKQQTPIQNGWGLFCCGEKC